MIEPAAEVLGHAGLPAAAVERWEAAAPPPIQPGEGSADRLEAAADRARRYWELGEALLAMLPAKPLRAALEAQSVAELLRRLRVSRAAFSQAFAEPIYASLTDHLRRFVRVEEIVYRAAERFPGLTPTHQAVIEERQSPLADRDGREIDQGLLVSALLASPRAGAHLVQAMLRPLEGSAELARSFRGRHELDLGRAALRRVGRAAIVELRNPERLNAEDDSTTGPLEAAIDVAILDPEIEVCVLRGGVVQHPKYAGRHVFNAGLNLTHLYYGQVSFLFYLTRDLGLVNKLYRGLSGERFAPEQPEDSLEKPWIAAVECFAIGGGCQLLLVMDYVLAERTAFFNLPARKEGIIPGAANLRLPRFLGDRLARQGILFDEQFPADSDRGRLLCDRLVEVEQMERAIEETVAALTDSGLVSAAANRKALRVAQEPLDTFRQYMALYAREQAYCHYSPALIANLERHWSARERRR